MLLERRELTAGSTWHAAGGMHTLNGDPNVARLQQYTIQLYEEIERVTGQDCSIHLPGGLMLADTEVRMDFLRMAQARGRYLGMELELISATRGAGPLPAAGPAVLRRRALRPGRGARGPDRRDPRLRQVRPAGRRRGPPAHAGRRARRSAPTARGTSASRAGDSIHAEHVVNAGGLWAREVGRMVGLELPVLAMEHIYLLTEDDARGRRVRRPDRPRDADGARLRRRDLHPPGGRGDAPGHVRAGLRALVAEGDAVGLRVAAPEAGPRPHHARAARSPSSTTRRWATIGIKTVVNGPFTFSPDGNPLVGPIRGLRGYWVACGVMAGLSQGGGVGPRAGDLDDRRRPRRQRHGYLGHGRRPLRRLRHARATRTPRSRRTTAAASGSPSPTRSCPPPGRC